MRVGFVLLIGVPGSGKTTFAKHLTSNVENCNANTHHFIHVCYDDLIDFRNEIQEFEWKSARNSVSVKIEKLVLALKNKNIDLCPEEFKNEFKAVKNWECDIVLILDDNMYFKSMRYSLFQIAKKHGVGFSQIFFKCSLENALMANNLRGSNSNVPSHVIENMFSKIEPPNCKNNWEKYSVELESFCDLNDNHSKILPTLKNALDNVFTERENDETSKELSKIQCKRSVVHQTDLALRKIVSCKIKKHLNSNNKSKDYITGLNLRKSEILSDVKTGNICFPEEILREINSDAVEKFGCSGGVRISIGGDQINISIYIGPNSAPHI